MNFLDLLLMANLMGSLIRGAIGVLLVQSWPLNNESNKSFNQSAVAHVRNAIQIALFASIQRLKTLDQQRSYGDSFTMSTMKCYFLKPFEKGKKLSVRKMGKFDFDHHFSFSTIFL